jgi:hypothetical protein
MSGKLRRATGRVTNGGLTWIYPYFFRQNGSVRPHRPRIGPPLASGGVLVHLDLPLGIEMEDLDGDVRLGIDRTVEGADPAAQYPLDDGAEPVLGGVLK